VQEELERALEWLVRAPVALSVAGRNGRRRPRVGPGRLLRGAAVAVKSLNALLPRDIAVLECERARDGFDARGDARSRTYCYRILTRAQRSPFRAAHDAARAAPAGPRALHACAAALPGMHDFTAFTPTETEHVRFERKVFTARWDEHPETLEFWIEADTFNAQHEPRDRRDDARGRVRHPHDGRLHRTAERCAAQRRGRHRTCARAGTRQRPLLTYPRSSVRVLLTTTTASTPTASRRCAARCATCPASSS